MKNIVLFDMDGTLTEPRQKMGIQMEQQLLKLQESAFWNTVSKFVPQPTSKWFLQNKMEGELISQITQNFLVSFSFPRLFQDFEGNDTDAEFPPIVRF